MEKSFLSFLFGSAVFVAPQIASASLLVAVNNFDSTLNTENASTAGWAHTGFSGLVTDGAGEASYDTGGSNDGTFGTSTFSEYTPGANDGYLRSINGVGPIVQVTNNSSTAYSLTSLLFDAASQSGGGNVAVTYRKGTSGTWLTLLTTGSLAIAGATGAQVNYGDYLGNLIGLGISLLGESGVTAANTIQFKFIASPNGRIDNIALTGLSAIPEPSSLAALGCLLGSGVFLRQRRRVSAAPLELA